MIEWGGLFVWLYCVYAVSRVPKTIKTTKKYKVKYSLPFNVWMQIRTDDKDYVLISNNQN